MEPDPAAHAQSPCENAHTRPSFLNWRRSSTNPFASEWERILTWVNTHPAQNTRDLFVELQQVFPGRYQASQYSALLSEAHAEAGEDALFLSERRLPLTPNAITLLFVRLSSRAGMTGKGVSLSLLRDTFAVRYLQQGGHPKTLQQPLGLASRAAIKRYRDAARSLPHQISMTGAPAHPFA